MHCKSTDVGHQKRACILGIQCGSTVRHYISFFQIVGLSFNTNEWWRKLVRDDAIMCHHSFMSCCAIHAWILCMVCPTHHANTGRPESDTNQTIFSTSNMIWFSSSFLPLFFWKIADSANVHVWMICKLLVVWEKMVQTHVLDFNFCAKRFGCRMCRVFLLFKITLWPQRQGKSSAVTHLLEILRLLKQLDGIFLSHTLVHETGQVLRPYHSVLHA